MAKIPTPIRGRGPTICALDPWAPSAGRIHQLLSDDERTRLAVMSSIVRFKKREIIYREGDPAEAVFNINAEVVGASKVTPDGREHIITPQVLLRLLRYPFHQQASQTPGGRRFSRVDDLGT
jgi:CRP-like cAMP-binding protein